MDPKQESIKKILKKTPAAGGENVLIRYLDLGTCGDQEGGGTLKYLALGT